MAGALPRRLGGVPRRRARDVASAQGPPGGGGDRRGDTGPDAGPHRARQPEDRGHLLRRPGRGRPDAGHGVPRGAGGHPGRAAGGSPHVALLGDDAPRGARAGGPLPRHPPDPDPDGGGGAARGYPPSGLHGPLAPPFRGAGEHPALGASPAQPDLLPYPHGVHRGRPAAAGRGVQRGGPARGHDAARAQRRAGLLQVGLHALPGGDKRRRPRPGCGGGDPRHPAGVARRPRDLRASKRPNRKGRKRGDEPDPALAGRGGALPRHAADDADEGRVAGRSGPGPHSYGPARGGRGETALRAARDGVFELFELGGGPAGEGRAQGIGREAAELPQLPDGQGLQPRRGPRARA